MDFDKYRPTIQNQPNGVFVLAVNIRGSGWCPSVTGPRGGGYYYNAAGRLQPQRDHVPQPVPVHFLHVEGYMSITNFIAQRQQHMAINSASPAPLPPRQAAAINIEHLRPYDVYETVTGNVVRAVNGYGGWCPVVYSEDGDVFLLNAAGQLEPLAERHVVPVLLEYLHPQGSAAVLRNFNWIRLQAPAMNIEDLRPYELHKCGENDYTVDAVCIEQSGWCPVASNADGNRFYLNTEGNLLPVNNLTILRVPFTSLHQRGQTAVTTKYNLVSVIPAAPEPPAPEPPAPATNPDTLGPNAETELTDINPVKRDEKGEDKFTDNITVELQNQKSAATGSREKVENESDKTWEAVKLNSSADFWSVVIVLKSRTDEATFCVNEDGGVDYVDNDVYTCPMKYHQFDETGKKTLDTWFPHSPSSTPNSESRANVTRRAILTGVNPILCDTKPTRVERSSSSNYPSPATSTTHTYRSEPRDSSSGDFTKSSKQLDGDLSWREVNGCRTVVFSFDDDYSFDNFKNLCIKGYRIGEKTYLGSGNEVGCYVDDKFLVQTVDDDQKKIYVRAEDLTESSKMVYDTIEELLSIEELKFGLFSAEDKQKVLLHNMDEAIKFLKSDPIRKTKLRGTAEALRMANAFRSVVSNRIMRESSGLNSEEKEFKYEEFLVSWKAESLAAVFLSEGYAKGVGETNDASRAIKLHVLNAIISISPVTFWVDGQRYEDCVIVPHKSLIFPNEDNNQSSYDYLALQKKDLPSGYTSRTCFSIDDQLNVKLFAYGKDEHADRSSVRPYNPCSMILLRYNDGKYSTGEPRDSKVYYITPFPWKASMKCKTCKKCRECKKYKEPKDFLLLSAGLSIELEGPERKSVHVIGCDLMPSGRLLDIMTSATPISPPEEPNRNAFTAAAKVPHYGWMEVYRDKNGQRFYLVSGERFYIHPELLVMYVPKNQIANQRFLAPNTMPPHFHEADPIDLPELVSAVHISNRWCPIVSRGYADPRLTLYLDVDGVLILPTPYPITSISTHQLHDRALNYYYGQV